MHRDTDKTLERFILLLIIFVLFPVELHPQNYSLKVFTTNEGLPHNNVREIVADRSGYLWICTWDGLSRYDGYEFKNYHHIPGDSTSIPFFSISRIVLDGSDNFWIQTDHGTLARFNRQTDNFSTIKRINGEEICATPDICNDEKGNLWIINCNTIFRYDPNSMKYTRYSIVFPAGLSSLNSGYLFNLTMEDNRTMWLASNVTFKLEIDENARVMTVKKVFPVHLRTLPPEKIIRNFDHTTWYKVYIDKIGRKWILSDLGLFLLNEKSQTVNEFTGNIPLKDFDGKDLIFWGGMEGGLNIYNPVRRAYIKIPPETVQLFKFGCPVGKDMIWYSNSSFTGNSIGLTRLIFTPDYFKKYTDLNKSEDLPAVFSVTVDNKKNVWLGIRGRNYITLITPENKILKKYTEASRMPGFFGPIRSIKRTPEGLWIGYFDNLLLFYDYKSESFRRFNPGRYLFRALEIREDGKLYIGNNELLIYDPLTGKKELLMDSIPGGGNFRFELDKDGILWSGIPYGMVLSYNPSEHKIRLFKTSNTTNNIEDVCPGNNGDIWLAVLGGGLVKFNTIKNESVVYTTSDGMSNNTVYSVLRDREGNIWASTDNGICRLNPSAGTIKKFGSAEGLDIVEFNSGASFIDDEGRFYFGGMGGAVSFFPDSINRMESDAADDKIILTRFTVSGKFRIIQKPIDKSDTISLEPGEDNFHLTFATTDFAVSEKVIYRYRLSGHDNEWIVTDHLNRNINYDNLRPGRYNLKLEATDRNGQWRAQRDLFIRIKPFFYQTKIFIIVSVLLIALIIVGMTELYILQVKQKARQTQDELRLQALRGQMNPHFIFNSLNSINYFISNNDKISANRYIADFARLIRSILSNMGSDYVSFTEEMGSVKDYLEIEHLRFGDKFEFDLNYPENGDCDLLEVFPGLIQPFVENAIWHGVRALEKRKGAIKIRLFKDDNQKIKCIIEDDGIGRKMSQELRKDNQNHNSRGIAIVQERLQIISKLRDIDYGIEISDLYPDRKEAGTRIEIDIPSRIIQ